MPFLWWDIIPKEKNPTGLFKTPGELLGDKKVSVTLLLLKEMVFVELICK